MTYLEVVDSAVKIGLGALIGGITSLVVARAQHRRDLEKSKIAREFELLKQVAEEVERFTHVALRYWALITEWGRNELQGTKMRAERQEALSRSGDELFDAFKDMTSSESKLLLLGHSESQGLLRAYGELVTELRRKANRDAPPLSDADASEWRRRILGAREQFFLALSATYRRLGA